MSELTVETLREIAPQDLAAMLPVVVRTGEQTAVILRLVEPATGLVELFQSGVVTQTTTTALDAEFVMDHAVQAELLRDALKLVHETALRKLTERAQEHEDKLAAIRQYAIERHEDGDICRDGLDRFLDHFDFEPFPSSCRIEFTICGSYVVDGSTEAAAVYDAERYLEPDLSSVDQVDLESLDYKVQVNVADV